jgi:ABC-type sugar transport system permease subunit
LMTHCRPTFWRLQQRAAPYLFVLPFLLLFGVFFLYPLVNSLVLSGRQFVGPRVSRGVGLGNYAFMLRDVGFWLSVLNTFLFAALFLAVELPLSLGLAVLLNSRRVRFRGVFRFAVFSPYLVGSVFASVIFMLLLTPRSGLINRAIGALLPWVGSDINWRGNALLAMPAVVLAALWLSTGQAMIYLLAALQAVDRELYEAAAVDGAGRWARFRHVTLPGVRPVLGFLVLAGTIYALQLFELPFVLFQGFGPRSSAMTVVGYLFANGFINQDIGYASAVGWVLVLLISLVAAAQVKGVGVRMKAEG